MELENDRDGIASDRARNLWDTCLTDVIELTEIVRQKDPIWAACLCRFRTNQPTKEDIELVNSRFIGPQKQSVQPLPPPSGSPDSSDPEGSNPNSYSNDRVVPPGTPAAVCWNKPREDGIKFAVGQYLKTMPPVSQNDVDWRKRGVLLIQADISRASGGQPLSIATQHNIRNTVSATKLGVFGNFS